MFPSDSLERQALDYFQLAPSQLGRLLVGPNVAPITDHSACCRQEQLQHHYLNSSSSSSSASQLPSRQQLTAPVTMRQASATKTAPKSPHEASSTSSSNSLPSIASSPSLSPSLVCPHLSLDDLLARGSLQSETSAHTVGLCNKCRLNPPPNIQSPLSPSYATDMDWAWRPRATWQRSQSDYDFRAKQRITKSDQKSPLSSKSIRVTSIKRSARAPSLRDDSLDYAVEPAELERLRLSPSLRNSVEFIRKNSSEAARVFRVYKNGFPFDKPLRVCMTRGEFSNLTHLLDHIASRQLVPSGARFLFHLDGQLVYSINELKHDRAYVVSGTRSFDFKASQVIRAREPAGRMRTRLECASPSVLQTRPQPLQQQKQQQQQHYPLSSSPNKRHASNLMTGGSNKMQSNNLSPAKHTKQHPPGPARVVSKRERPADYGSKSDPNRVKDRPGALQRANSLISQNRTAASSQVERAEPSAMSSTSPRRMKTRPSAADSRAPPTKVSRKPISEKPMASVMRSKSELSGLPRRQKKNVTFSDTGRGSSPAIVDLISGDHKQEEATLKASPVSTTAETSAGLGSKNEIGIQVSDSIEGFLIDLPLPLPGAPDSHTNGHRRGPAGGSRRGRGRASGRPVRASPRPKVVTITERQLSTDELNKFRDLDHGNHHAEERQPEPPVTINLQHTTTPTPDSDIEVVVNAQKAPVQGQEATEQPKTTIEQLESSQMSATSQAVVEMDEQIKIADTQPSRDWQYPGGQESGVTPTERPVSQSEADSTGVQARVTTPTASLSTGGDSSSLTMTYEQIVANHKPGHISELDSGSPAAGAKPQSEVDLSRGKPSVQGRLRSGLSPPARNFQLAWVSGFAINDLYPDNSTARTLTTDGPTVHVSSATMRTHDSNFKPSDRYNNWVYYSRKHDELVYPAGMLVVLWARRLDEQRYYSRHTANVAALTLASQDTDLAASAQIDEPTDRLQPGSIHLWSITSLETLRIIDGDHFRGRRIYSLQMRNSNATGCELQVGAREERRLWFYAIYLRLGPEQADSQPAVKTRPKTGERSPARSALGSSSKPQEPLVIKYNKLLQANQMPLLQLKLSNSKLGETSPETKTEVGASAARTPDSLVLSFGRRHFQVWAAQRRRQKLQLLQASSRGPQLAELVTKATCIARLAPMELLVGDLEGNISLAVVRPEPGDTYALESQRLVEGTRTDSGPITCLARISGNLFASGDSGLVLRFWRIERQGPKSSEAGEQASHDTNVQQRIKLHCKQLSSISLPADLGFVCALVLVNYRRQQRRADFFLVSTSNAVLLGSVQLEPGPADGQAELLANSSLSVVYEGHETSVMSLASEPAVEGQRHRIYFTCGLDQRICKWNGRRLIWKSLVPSACASLALHPDGPVLAAGSADGTVYVLDRQSGLLASYFPLTPVCINCLAYSREGSLLAAGCANGSIFILPVYDHGLAYRKVSIFQSPYPVELILWDLPKFRFMRDGVRQAADKISWLDSICSGSEDVRAIWENANLASVPAGRPGQVVNLSCHRLLKPDEQQQQQQLVVASDMRGWIRLFRYPCYDIQQAFYEARVSSSPANTCRFLSKGDHFVSTSLDGSIFIWALD